MRLLADDEDRWQRFVGRPDLVAVQVQHRGSRRRARAALNPGPGESRPLRQDGDVAESGVRQPAVQTFTQHAICDERHAAAAERSLELRSSSVGEAGEEANLALELLQLGVRHPVGVCFLDQRGRLELPQHRDRGRTMNPCGLQ